MPILGWDQLAAFGLPIVLFAFWLVLGYALLWLLYTRRNLLQNALLAPVVGMATTMFCTFWLNRFGIPVAIFAIALGVGLLLVTVALLWWLRPIFPLRRYLPFAALFCVALVLSGLPLLQFGWDWLGFSNLDMANYTLYAQRNLHTGMFTPPTSPQWLVGTIIACTSGLRRWPAHAPAARSCWPGQQA